MGVTHERKDINSGRGVRFAGRLHDRFRFHTHKFVWLVATLISFSLIQTDHSFDPIAIAAETLLAFVFVTIERLGSELRDPFENRANDTPMSAICCSIEIDLLQQLGETELPPPWSR